MPSSTARFAGAVAHLAPSLTNLQDPRKDYDTTLPGAVGELGDAVMLSQFSGADRMRALSLSQLFARPGAAQAAPAAGPPGRRSLRLGARPPPPDSLDFLQKLFDQVCPLFFLLSSAGLLSRPKVRLERWYPALAGQTYKTMSVALVEAEAVALLHKHEEEKAKQEQRTILPILSEEERRLLTSMSFYFNYAAEPDAGLLAQSSRSAWTRSLRFTSSARRSSSCRTARQRMPCWSRARCLTGSPRMCRTMRTPSTAASAAW